MNESDFESRENMQSEYALKRYLIEGYPEHKRRLYFSSVIRILMLLSVWGLSFMALFQPGHITTALVVISILTFYAAIDLFSTFRRAREDHMMVWSLVQDQYPDQ